MKKLLVLVVVITSFSCKEDDYVIDPRDQMIGTYGCIITNYDRYGRFLSQGSNAIRLFRKNTDPSIIEIIENGELFCQVEIETADGGFYLHVLPGQLGDGYSIVDHVDGFYDQDGDFVEVVRDDSSFYDSKTNRFWLYYTVLYSDTPSRFVILDGKKI